MPAPPPRAAPTSGVFLRAALIVVLGVWIYWPALRGPFVWDDFAEIPQNPVLRDPHGLGKIWAGSVGADYFPLKTTLQWFLWQGWGAHPAGYHVLNLALHLLNALLFWRLLQRLGVRLPWIGGLLFAVHPLAVESAAWIAEFKNTLSGTFLLGAMIAYVDFDRACHRAGDPAAGHRPDRPPRAFYLCSLVFYLLALLSKSSVVMFPFIILLHAWWKRGRIGRQDLGPALPFFGLSLLLGLVTVFFQYHRALSLWTIPLHGLRAHLALAGSSAAFYLWKSLVPLSLHPMYRPWDVNSSPLLFLLPWPGFALLLGWAWARRTTWGRHVLFGLGFFLINLAPVLGFLPMSYMHITWVADHFAYLSLLGVAGLGAAGAGIVWQRTKAALRGGVAGLAALLVLALAGFSRADAAPFASNDVLWRRVLRLNPEAWMAHIDLGYDISTAGHNEAAIEQYDQALRIRSDLPEAYYDRGSAFLQLGRLPAAIGDFEQSLRLLPGNPDALANLGNALLRSDRLPEAIARYQEALRIQPKAIDIRTNLVQALIRSLHSSLAATPLTARHLYDAFTACQEILRLDPGNVEAHADLGNLFYAQRRLPEAISEYQAALRLKPDDADTQANLNRAERALAERAP